MNKIFITSITIIGFLFIGCGSKSGPDLSPEASSKTVKNVPDWYLETPNNEGYVYAAANGTSQNMQLAIDKARRFQSKNLLNCVAASDAFFPFTDGLEKLIQSGVSAVIQPQGSIRDKEIIKLADKTKTVLVFSKTRHFKH